MHQVLVHRCIASRFHRMHGEIEIHVDIHRRKIVIGLKALRPIGIGGQIAGHVSDKGADQVTGEHGRAYFTAQQDRVNTGNAQLLPGTGHHRYRFHILIRAPHPAFQHQRHGIHLGDPQRLGFQVELVERQPMQARGLRIPRISQCRLGLHQLLDRRVAVRHIIFGQPGRQRIGDRFQQVLIKIFQAIQCQRVGIPADRVFLRIKGDVMAFTENPHIHQFTGLLMFQLDRIAVAHGGLHQWFGKGDAYRRKIHERKTCRAFRVGQIGLGVFLINDQHLRRLVRHRIVLASAEGDQRTVLLQVHHPRGNLR